MAARGTLPVVLGTGDHASRPAAGDVGAGGIYACSDHQLIYQSDGTTWSTWASLAGTGYTPGGTDVAIADGGTGASTAAGARDNLGLEIGADVPSQAAFDDHSARHEDGGADEISIAGLAGTPVAVSDHLSDATDAHDASAISIADAGTLYTATDAEAAFAEIATRHEGHLSDADDAHDADAISLDPTGFAHTAATEVQAGMADLDAAITGAAAGGIPASNLNAKGDILGASANDTPAVTSVGTDGQRLRADSAQSAGLAWGWEEVAIPFIIDGSGAVITTGIKGDFEIPFAHEIIAWRLLADQSGSIVIDLWRDTYANFPPVVGDTIITSGKPTLSSATKAEGTSLAANWSEVGAAGDIYRVNVDSVATITRVTLSLTVRKL